MTLPSWVEKRPPVVMDTPLLALTAWVSDQSAVPPEALL